MTFLKCNKMIVLVLFLSFLLLANFNITYSKIVNQDDFKSRLQDVNSSAYKPFSQQIIIKLDKNKLISANEWREIKNLAGSSYLYKNQEGVYYRIFASTLIIFVPANIVFKDNYLNSTFINAIESFSNRQLNSIDREKIELISLRLASELSKKIDDEQELETSFGLKTKFYISSFGEKGIYCSMQ